MPSPVVLLVGNGEIGDSLLNDENPFGIRLGISIANIPSFPFPREEEVVEEEGPTSLELSSFDEFPVSEIVTRGCITISTDGDPMLTRLLQSGQVEFE